MLKRTPNGFNTKDIIDSLMLMQIIQAPLDSNKRKRQSSNEELPATKRPKIEESIQISDILPDAEKRKKIMEDLNLSSSTLTKLDILNAIAAGAFEKKLLLSDSEFTNNSIRELLPHAKVSAEAVLSAYHSEANECEDKLKDLSGREKEINELFEFVKKKVDDCSKTVRGGEKIGLAEMQILESNALKCAKKILEFNEVLTGVQKKQEKLYDTLAQVTPAVVQNSAPKLRM